MSRINVARGILQAFSEHSGCPHHAFDTRPFKVAKLTGGGVTKDYAFEMICSTLRFGRGVTAELGFDVQRLNARHTLLVTDKTVVNTNAFKVAAQSLKDVGVKYTVFDDCMIEPTDSSMLTALNFARQKGCDSFVAIGGGSVIDTAKAAALYASNPDSDFLDFVGVPFGRGLLPENPMLPLIAIPTTAGTGSETTAVSIMDLPDENCKTGIRVRCLKPMLALVDPLNVLSMPRNVAIYSGFDVLCHALESYTALPYNERSPRPLRPELRPLYQGSNPISDVWSKEALRIIAKYFRRSIADASDEEARTHMMMASSFAGVGFGNAGVHLCHGLSYPISSQGKHYHDCDYPKTKPLIPHGLSVVTTAVADFEFTTPAYLDRHAEAARCLGISADAEYVARSLCDEIRSFMSDFKVPNGLKELGFSVSDIDKLTDSAVAAVPNIAISPRRTDREIIAKLYEKSMTVY
ncbi:unnamed protein product [Auanema sp. JU1783]|nr:unnamed protein product [Auanema sp. JU1783]